MVGFEFVGGESEGELDDWCIRRVYKCGFRDVGGVVVVGWDLLEDGVRF